jgi:hypothetical protein
VADLANLAAFLFIYKLESTLIDGSTTPGRRNGLFFGPSATGNAIDPRDAEHVFLNTNGRKLLGGAINYAAAITQPSSTLQSLMIGALGLLGLARQRAH